MARLRWLFYSNTLCCETRNIFVLACFFKGTCDTGQVCKIGSEKGKEKYREMRAGKRNGGSEEKERVSRM